jgi:diguanylate cyclase (GGDEF)-like protein
MADITIPADDLARSFAFLTSMTPGLGLPVPDQGVLCRRIASDISGFLGPSATVLVSVHHEDLGVCCLEALGADPALHPVLAGLVGNPLHEMPLRGGTAVAWGETLLLQVPGGLSELVYDVLPSETARSLSPYLDIAQCCVMEIGQGGHTFGSLVLLPGRRLESGQVVAIETYVRLACAAWLRLGAEEMLRQTRQETERLLSERDLQLAGGRRELEEQRDLVARMMDVSPAGVVLLSPEGRFEAGNLRAETILSSFLPAPWTFPLPIAVRDADGRPLPEAERPFARAREERRAVVDALLVVEGAGAADTWLRASCAPVLSEHGAVTHLVLTFRDVGQEIRAENALRESEERYRAIVEDQTELICRFGEDFVLTFVNRAYFRSCFSADSAHPVVLAEGSRFQPACDDAFMPTLSRTLGFLDDQVPVATLEHHAPWDAWYQWTLRVIRRRESGTVEYQAVGREITDQKKREDDLSRAAMHDILTGLPNRSLFVEHLYSAIARCARSGRPIAVYMVDLDLFKTVNDTLGHAAGDQLLQAVSERLLRTFRKGDVVSRFGGDEFVVLTDRLDQPEHAITIGQRLLTDIQEPFVIEGRTIQMSASVGVALFPDHGQDPRMLLRQADAAMYEAKRSGRNNLHMASP